MRILWAILGAAVAAAAFVPTATAQDKGTLNPQPLPPLANPDDPGLPAKQLFGRALSPAELQTRSIGSYARGCLAGAQALPIDGETWQVMRLSRNRNWGNPALLDFLERLSKKVPSINGWPGLLIGDISQPRGGPALTGHASHQIGLDADVWLTPMPDRTLSKAEREQMSALNMVREDGLDVNDNWTPAHLALIKATAEMPEVERIFVNPAIKKALCRDARGDRSWLHKVRPWWGHNYHYHIRIACPEGEDMCQGQDPVPAGDGCDASLDAWFTDAMLHPKPSSQPPKQITMSQLPPECRQVLISK